MIYSFLKYITPNKKKLKNNYLTPPTSLYIEITSECNLRCKHCHMWLNKDSQNNALTTAEKVMILDQFKELNSNGNVIFTGGETFLKDEFFVLASHCRDIGLPSVAVTNGSFFNKSIHLNILTKGVNTYSISLDSHKAEIHDYIRGVKGSFQHLVSEIKALVNFRQENKINNVNLYVNCVLFEKNISDVLEYVSFCKNLGVDGILFQCLQEGHEQSSEKGNSSFFNKNFFHNKLTAISKIDELIKLSNKEQILKNSVEDFQWMKHYINDKENFSTYKQFCSSHYKNIIIDHEGNYSLCLNMAAIENIQFDYNYKSKSLKDFWESSSVNNVRQEMNNCRKTCGILNCHRKND